MPQNEITMKFDDDGVVIIPASEYRELCSTNAKWIARERSLETTAKAMIVKLMDKEAVTKLRRDEIYEHLYRARRGHNQEYTLGEFYPNIGEQMWEAIADITIKPLGMIKELAIAEVIKALDQRDKHLEMLKKMGKTEE